MYSVSRNNLESFQVKAFCCSFTDSSPLYDFKTLQKDTTTCEKLDYFSSMPLTLFKHYKNIQLHVGFQCLENKLSTVFSDYFQVVH